MKHRVPHSLDQETARRVLREAADDYARRLADHGPSVRFVGSDRVDVHFAARGISLSGSVVLEPGAIVFDLEVPLLLRPFKRRAIAAVEREVRRWVARAERDSE